MNRVRTIRQWIAALASANVISSLSAAILMSSAFTASACAAISPENLSKAIEDAKILGPDYKITATFAGQEAVVSTYLNRASKDQEKDCKIDAVLIAKKVMELDSDKVRVKVRFYTFDQKSYQELTVTAGDIAAFGSGSISQDKLLASLEARTMENSAARIPTSGASSAASSAARGSAPTAPKQSPDGKFQYCQIGDLAFYHPRSWVRKQGVRKPYGKEETVLAQFISTTSEEDATVTLSVWELDSPSQKLKWDQQWWQENNYKMLPAESLNIGYGRIAAISQTVGKKTSESNIWVDRNVYFGYPSRCYVLNLSCDNKKSKLISEDFKYFLATVHFVK